MRDAKLRKQVAMGEELLRSANNDVRRMRAFLNGCRRDAEIVISTLELGDHRLTAMDGPCGGQLPDLYPWEWGKVYRACKRIAKKLGGTDKD